MDLSIIIVNWNSKEYLQKCIASILLWTSDIKYEIVVIDSASFDGCGEMLRQLFPQRPIVLVTEGLKSQESFHQDVATWLQVECCRLASDALGQLAI
jgi:glycosyltransferase involved in cell wall biosynthesis